MVSQLEGKLRLGVGRSNAVLFVVAQFISRFANTFLGSAVRYELLEVGGAAKFAMSQVVNNVARMFLSQVSGLLADQFSLKFLYVVVEALNFLLLLVLVAPYWFAASPTSGLLFWVNLGFGLSQAFSQPVGKSMPRAVAEVEHLAMVNSWDLTGDKVARYLAPMAFTMVSSILTYRAAMTFSFGLYLVLLVCKLLITVKGEARESKMTNGTTGAGGKFMAVFQKLWSGLKTMQGIIGLLALNTLLTNTFIYPLNSVAVPILLKQIPPDSMARSDLGAVLLRWQDALGIKKAKAWMNYAALISVGGAVGPFLSNFVVMYLEALSEDDMSIRVWRGIKWSLSGQVLSSILVAAAISLLGRSDPGMLVFVLLLSWALVVAVNNMFTIYFNSYAQTVLKSNEQGRFIANVMTLFSLGNSAGTFLFGMAMSERGEGLPISSQINQALGLLMCGVAGKVVIFCALSSTNPRLDKVEPEKRNYQD